MATASKVGRNERCPCGSGKKYKACCGLKERSRGVSNFEWIVGSRSLDCEELYTEFQPLAERQALADRELIRFCEQQDTSTLASSISYKRSTGQAYRETVGSVLSHLFIHQVHHRGQVHDMLSSTSVAPPQLDEFFLSGDLPLREQVSAQSHPDRRSRVSWKTDGRRARAPGL